MNLSILLHFEPVRSHCQRGLRIYYNTVWLFASRPFISRKESISMTVCPDGAKARLANHHLRGWCSHWALCCSSAEHASICSGYTLDSPPQLTLIEGIRETASSLKYPTTLPPFRHHHHHHHHHYTTTIINGYDHHPAPVLPSSLLQPLQRPTFNHLSASAYGAHRLDQLHHRHRIIAIRAAGALCTAAAVQCAAYIENSSSFSPRVN